MIKWPRMTNTVDTLDHQPIRINHPPDYVAWDQCYKNTAVIYLGNLPWYTTAVKNPIISRVKIPL
jgi:hypothetical protein